MFGTHQSRTLKHDVCLTFTGQVRCVMWKGMIGYQNYGIQRRWILSWIGCAAFLQLASSSLLCSVHVFISLIPPYKHKNRERERENGSPFSKILDHSIYALCPARSAHLYSSIFHPFHSSPPPFFISKLVITIWLLPSSILRLKPS